MKIIITMAGAGTRFRNAGYTVPKYEIVSHGRTLFAWSMLSLRGFPGGSYVFVVRAEDDCADFLRAECAALGIADYVIVPLAQPTRGQAETAMLAKPYWRGDEPMVIYNIDTFVEPMCMTAQELRGDGFIPCFAGEGDHWSFVRLDAHGAAVEVREKKRISAHCTVGAYYFKSCALYEQLYHACYDGGALEAGEQYVAPMYNTLIAQGGKVYISDIAPQRVHVLGTPEELRVFDEKVLPDFGG